MGPNTRNKSKCLFTEFLGAGKEMLESEVPTLRDALRKVQLIKEQNIIIKELNPRNINISKIVYEVVSDIIRLWKKSNIKFVPPDVSQPQSIHKRLMHAWNKVSDIVRNRITGKGEIQMWKDKLDSLFDITNCKCKIETCNSLGQCGSSCNGYHIICSCTRDKKLPTLELEWILHERQKKVEKSCLMISHVDTVESKKQRKALKRKYDSVRTKRNKLLQIDEENQLTGDLNPESDDSRVNFEEGEVEELEYPQYSDEPSTSRNYMSIKHTAAASLRFQNSATQTAVTCTAFLKDLIEAGELSCDKKYLALDKKKVMRAQNLLLREASELGETKANKDIITGIFFDGRKDNTKVLIYNEATNRYHQKIEKEEHISVTSEPDGCYRMHYTPPEAIHPNKPSQEVAIMLHEWLIRHDQDSSILVLGGDSTNPMTGWKGGAIAWLEKLLNRKTFWVICQIHTNELPLRHLIEKLDGKTTSKSGFSGPIGKKLSEINSMERNLKFTPIPLLQPLIEIPAKILKEMSTDSALSYRLVQALSKGEISQELADMRSGGICQSRWLTTGMAFMYLWASNHEFEGETLEKFKYIVSFIVQVYFPMFFEIKVKHTIVDAPYHVLTQLKLVKQQNILVQQTVEPYVRSGAWFSHSESLLLSLLASSENEDRIFAVDTIIQLRKGQEKGDKGVRSRKTPYLNIEANRLRDLIYWNKEKVSEPIFTCDISLDELKGYKEVPFKAPYYPNHTQSTERAVQQVTQAASSVCGHEKRDGYVRARIAHRETVPSFRSKKDCMKLF